MIYRQAHHLTIVYDPLREGYLCAAPGEWIIQYPAGHIEIVPDDEMAPQPEPKPAES